MGIDDGDVIGDGPSPHDDGPGIEPGGGDAAVGGADAGTWGDEAPFGASPLHPEPLGPLNSDPLHDAWESDSDGLSTGADVDGPTDPVSGGPAAGPGPVGDHDPTGDPAAPAPDTGGPHDGSGATDAAPVDLTTSDPGDPGDPAHHPIHLDIDDVTADLDHNAATDDMDAANAFQSPLLGLTPPEVTDHSLAALGVAPDAFDAALARMGIADPELGLDGRTVGIAMGEVGVDAVVEHAGLDDLLTLLGEGRQVLLTGPPDAPVVQLTGIDIASGQVEVEDVATGVRHTVGIDAVEASWAASGYQMVTSSATAAATADPGRVGASVAVVQAVIAAWQ